MKMKLKSGFFLNEMGDEFVVVAMTDEAKKVFGGMLRLNATGAFLFEKLETEKTYQQLVSAIVEKYSVDIEAAKADCADFIDVLRGVGLIDE